MILIEIYKRITKEPKEVSYKQLLQEYSNKSFLEFGYTKKDILKQLEGMKMRNEKFLIYHNKEYLILKSKRKSVYLKIGLPKLF